MRAVWVAVLFTLGTIAGAGPATANEACSLSKYLQPDHGSERTESVPMECLSNRAEPLTWLHEAASTGIECQGKIFRLASSAIGANFNVWVLVEEPPLPQEITELLITGFREVRMGWNWQTPLTKDALTLKWQMTATQGYSWGPEYLVTGSTITDQCGVVVHQALVDATRKESYAVWWTFSGAEVTYVNQRDILLSVTLSESHAYKWNIGVSKKEGPSVNYGWEDAYGSSSTRTYGIGTSVSFHSITKTAQGSFLVSGGPSVPVTVLDAIPVDGLAFPLCMEYYFNQQGQLDTCAAIPVEHET